MDALIVGKLLDLNQRFYTERAKSFSVTRAAPWPGFQQLLTCVRDGSSVLDIGCGNGRLAVYLDKNLGAGTYVGLDFSEPMLEAARRSSQQMLHLQADFRRADISRPDWVSVASEGGYDAVVALAVLQHLPSFELRASVVAQAARLLAPHGILVTSHWQFLESEELRRRIVPWGKVGIAESDLEPGDFLVEWRRDGIAYRYCHLVTELEVSSLARYAELDLARTFRADGREGNLNLYALLARPASEEDTASGSLGVPGDARHRDVPGG